MTRIAHMQSHPIQPIRMQTHRLRSSRPPRLPDDKNGPNGTWDGRGHPNAGLGAGDYGQRPRRYLGLYKVTGTITKVLPSVFPSPAGQPKAGWENNEERGAWSVAPGAY
ncbi:hypothetical protein GGTG_02443 [Gaeumannomyces tritici R3-111a-1]|uniref:Uncharacterized protein n=1 Tax=Gaeumannomyces tritici (strain R3-111a-1) TaxID=644352 RepID=J3NMD9_GAET3|nr:hypothetical protein GGTG_02443 [Gaeumannomyces tritici R3-111a-1]EJT82470.1 hypothetical protein GGTG_02443 [Gaeumannomyces tritici R3-111a-1]